MELNEELEDARRLVKLEQEKKKAKEMMERQQRFSQLFLPTLLYGFIFALCLYNNMSGILMPVFSMATLFYCYYVMKIWEVKVKKLSCFCGIIMILLGLASCLTGNEFIQFYNFAGIFLLLIFFLVHSFYNDEEWGFLKSVGAIGETIIETIGAVVDPFMDFQAYSKSEKTKEHKNIIHVAIGIVIAVPITSIAVAMLMSADIVFKGFSEKLIGNIDFGTIVGVVIFFIIGFFLAYCALVSLSRKGVKEEVKNLRVYSAVVAITSLVAISIIYSVFCYIQIAYLFIGGMTLPEGYTYAQYVHEGFYQLLFVCVMNLLIVLAALGFFEENIILNALLVIVSICTGVMIASCGFRITMYVSVYGLSFQRILVYWTLAVVSAFLIGIVIQIFWSDFKLFRYGLVVFCLLYLILAFGKSDYYIADYNLNNIASVCENNVDFEYINSLSSDAAPVVAGYMAHNDGKGNSYLESYANRMREYSFKSWRKFNFSRYKGHNLFENLNVK